MTVPFTNVSNSATITTAERSLPANTTSGVPTSQTTAIAASQVAVDRSAMASGTQINLVVYEKVNGGTQRVVETYPMVGTGTIDIFNLPPLGEGYDITLKKIAGADTVLAWSIREDVGDRNAVTAGAAAVTSIQAGLATSAAVAAVQADTDDLQSRLPAALVSGRIDASVGAYQSGQAPLQPTVAGRTLDVSAGGEAGLDWANIGSPTTVQGLSGTTVKDATDAHTDVTTLIGRLTAARAGYIDNLNVGGNVASSAEATAIQNNTRTVRVVPDVIERPDSGTQSYRIELYLYDDIGNMEVPDSAPTMTLVNASGTDLSARLSATTMVLVATGVYRVTYTASVGDALEQLIFGFSVPEGGITRLYANTALVVDTTAVDFTATDRTKLNTLAADYTTVRAGYLDNLSAGAVALASTAVAIKAKTDNLPTDPADASDIATSFATAATSTATLQTTANAIKAKTDNLPSDPADASDIAATTGAILSAVSSVQTDTTTLTGRLTNIRAGYLDNLSGGVVALHSDVVTIESSLTSIASAVAAVQASVDVANAALSRILLLLHENSIIDGPVTYGSSGVLTSARVRGFANATAQAAATLNHPDNADGEVARWQIIAVDNGSGGFSSFRIIKVL